MCGATGQQKSLEAAQANFYTQMTQEYGQVFSQWQAISGELTSALAPVVGKGPNQEGFGSPELLSLRSGATEGVAENYAKASAALGERQTAEGGSDFVVSGQDEAERAQLAESAAQETSREQNQITEADYATGRENFWKATSGLAGVESMLNPSTFAGATTGAGSAAGKTADEIAQAGNAWIGPVMGAIGGVAGGFLGNFNFSGKGGGSGGGGGGGGDSVNGDDGE